MSKNEKMYNKTIYNVNKELRNNIKYKEELMKLNKEEERNQNKIITLQELINMHKTFGKKAMYLVILGFITGAITAMMFLKYVGITNLSSSGITFLLSQQILQPILFFSIYSVNSKLKLNALLKKNQLASIDELYIKLDEEKEINIYNKTKKEKLNNKIYISTQKLERFEEMLLCLTKDEKYSSDVSFEIEDEIKNKVYRKQLKK